VLISGETGTGKELIAQTIHRLSSRGNRVMVKVNCAALPSALVESELFGREKGAFTGALMRQIGRFELADGSTIFLDELGELSLDVQSKLLRVLQEGQFERLGSPKTIKVNVRVIGATNRDLAEEVRKGAFRADLYYRLNVFPILVPPLRDRPEDIPPMVWAFIEEFSSRMGKKITQVQRKTMEMLQRYTWPGNVRELRNVIEHSTIITTDETLRVPMLEHAAPEELPILTLADAEREHILKALEKTGWRIKGPDGAAALLGLNPSTLYGRMRKLGIQSRSRNGEGRD
jgi:formate hydrogenlyase transcriptional activator